MELRERELSSHSLEREREGKVERGGLKYQLQVGDS